MKKVLFIVVLAGIATMAQPAPGAEKPSNALSTVSVIPSNAPTPKYKNCKALNRVYPHGVGRGGAKDKTTGEPVTNFRVSKRVYSLNLGLDRDRDRIACEKN
jgi:hypothetical protein